MAKEPINWIQDGAVVIQLGDPVIVHGEIYSVVAFDFMNGLPVAKVFGNGITGWVEPLDMLIDMQRGYWKRDAHNKWEQVV